MKEYATYLDAHNAGFSVYPLAWENVTWRANPYPNHTIANGNNMGYTEIFKMNEYIQKESFTSNAGDHNSRVTVTGIKPVPTTMGSLSNSEFVTIDLLDGGIISPPTDVVITVQVSSGEFDPYLTVDYIEDGIYKERIVVSQWMEWSKSVLSGTTVNFVNAQGSYGENATPGRVTYPPYTPRTVTQNTLFGFSITR